MTIDEAKDMKSNFERGIAAAIEVFEKETGCQVVELNIIKTTTSYMIPPVMTDVVAKIEL